MTIQDIVNVLHTLAEELSQGQYGDLAEEATENNLEKLHDAIAETLAETGF